MGLVREPAVIWRALDAELARARTRGATKPRVVDVGGGSGVWAVPLAVAGCLVTVVEPNPNAIATLHRRAQEAGVTGQITVITEDSDALTTVVAEDSADLVLAHGLLEVVADPNAVVRALASITKPGGAISLLAANKYAAVLQRVFAGNFVAATRLLEEQTGVLSDERTSLLRRFDVSELSELLTVAGLTVTLAQGEGVVHDLAIEPDETARARFEAAAAVVPALRDVASRLQVIGRR